MRRRCDTTAACLYKYSNVLRQSPHPFWPRSTPSSTPHPILPSAVPLSALLHTLPGRPHSHPKTHLHSAASHRICPSSPSPVCTTSLHPLFRPSAPRTRPAWHCIGARVRAARRAVVACGRASRRGGWSNVGGSVGGRGVGGGGSEGGAGGSGSELGGGVQL